MKALLHICWAALISMLPLISLLCLETGIDACIDSGWRRVQ